VGVFFKCPTQERNMLAIDCVIHRLDNLLRKACFLMIVHQNNLLPIIGYFIQVVRSSNIDKVQDILLETRPSKTDGRFQEFWTDTGILTDRSCDLVYVSSTHFT